MRQYQTLIKEMAASEQYFLPWNDEFWQRLRSPLPGLVQFFHQQLQLRCDDPLYLHRKYIVLEAMSHCQVQCWRPLLSTVAGLLVRSQEGRAVQTTALRFLVQHSAHGLIGRVLRRVDGGEAAWLRTHYLRAVVRMNTLELAGDIDSKRMMINFFSGRYVPDFFINWRRFVGQVGKRPALAQFVLAWLQKRDRLPLAANQCFAGSSLLAHLAAIALQENPDSEKMLQLLLTRPGRTIVTEPVFAEQLPELPEQLKLDLLDGVIAAWRFEQPVPDDQLAYDLIAGCKLPARQIAFALEVALGKFSANQSFREKAAAFLCLLHYRDRKLARHIRTGQGGKLLAGLIAHLRSGRLLAGARALLQQKRSHRYKKRLFCQQPDLVEQLAKNPKLVEDCDTGQLAWLHMQMRNPILASKLQPVRPIYLQKCRALLDANWPKITRIVDDYARGKEYVGQDPFLDALEDRAAEDPDSLTRLPDEIISIGAIFGTVRIRYRSEGLPGWFRHVVQDDNTRLTIEKVIGKLAIRTLGHDDDMAWLDYYQELFGNRLHLAVLAAAGKSSRPGALSSLLVKAVQIAGIGNELAGVIAKQKAKPDFASRPAAGCWQLAAGVIDGRPENADLLVKLGQDETRRKLILKMAASLRRDKVFISIFLQVALLELALTHFGEKDFAAGLQLGIDATAAGLVLDLRDDLERNCNWQTHDALRRLADAQCFAGFSSQAQAWVRGIIARSLPAKLARQFSPLPTAAIGRLIERGIAPLDNITSLQIFFCEQVRTLEQECRNGQGDLWNMFWNMEDRKAIKHKWEKECRNYIARLMRERLQQNQVTITVEPELAGEQRADLLLACGQAQLPVEIKCGDNNQLSQQGLRQIDCYTRYPGASGHGIYLVLWFGEQAGKETSPSDLERQLAERM
ncbi:MAG: hypothetical protein OXC81_01140, partial [Betaproteobacteria bacterium]|nr:hypothetical protein [Betaproteobacteria bacterium]